MNDGGIKRGDRAETGDLAARETDTVDEQGSGSEQGVITARPDALAGGPEHTKRTKLDTLQDSTLAAAKE